MGGMSRQVKMQKPFRLYAAMNPMIHFGRLEITVIVNFGNLITGVSSYKIAHPLCLASIFQSRPNHHMGRVQYIHKRVIQHILN